MYGGHVDRYLVGMRAQHGHLEAGMIIDDAQQRYVATEADLLRPHVRGRIH